MSSPSKIHTVRPLDLAYLIEMATRYEVPFVDTILIAMNHEGANSLSKLPRARMQLRPIKQSEVWQVILPLDNPASSFFLTDDTLYLNGEPVADLVGIENDDVVLTYLRAGGRSLTLNTHSRSMCIGCVFCPNVIEDAADGNVSGDSALEKLLRWTCADNDWPDLRGVEVITICSGCFNNPYAAFTHLYDIRIAASRLGFTGIIHLLSSVVRARQDIERFAREVGPFHLTLTIECLTRRELLLKASKASLTLDDACRIMDDCSDLGIIADFTYVAGLDPFEVAVFGLKRLAQHATTFPRIQVYQAHNDYMRRYRSPAAKDLGYFLALRREVESAYVNRGLRPRSWENYRPLWYTEYAAAQVEGPRI